MRLEQATKQWLLERQHLSLEQLAQEYLAHHQSILDKREQYAQSGISVSYRQTTPQLRHLPKDLQAIVLKRLSN